MCDISVLIVNYNTAELVKKCVEALINQRDVNMEIIVVDNNSRDHSVATLQQFGAQIKLIVNQDNVGFGKANNQAFHVSRGRYLFMLNPDACCLRDSDLFHVVQYMDQHVQYGLVGTRIINASQCVVKTAFQHYPRQDQSSVNFSRLPGALATVLGASMIARREVFELVGGFDEDYFLYAEETDLCLRIRKAGHMIGYLDGVTVQHVGSASEKGNPRVEVVRKKKAGKLLFYRKHYSKVDVVNIMRRDRWHAKIQLMLLSIKKKLFGLSELQQARVARHQVAYELATTFLNSSQAPN